MCSRAATALAGILVLCAVKPLESQDSSLGPAASAASQQSEIEVKAAALRASLRSAVDAKDHLGDTDRALEFYREALPAFQASADKKGLETATKNIAQLNRDRRNRSSDRN